MSLKILIIIINNDDVFDNTCLLIFVKKDKHINNVKVEQLQLLDH